MRRSGLILALGTVILSAASGQPKLYVVSQDWHLTIVDVQALKVVDDFEIVQDPPPLIDPRTFAARPLLVSDRDLLFVSNTARALPPNYYGGGLKIMKVDIRTRTSAPYFLDPMRDEMGPGLMGDHGALYFDQTSELVYACYGDEPVTYAINLNGEIQHEYTSPGSCPRQGVPRFGNKLYMLGKNRLGELDLETLTRTTVLEGLEFVGGSPYTGGDLKFFNYEGNTARILIADRGAVLYDVIRESRPPWTITTQTQCVFYAGNEQTDDISGYKRFVGDYLTIYDGDVRLWVFDPSAVPKINFVYEVKLPTAGEVWQDDPDAPRDPFGPTPYLVPGTNIVAALYSGLGAWRSVKLLLIDAATSTTLKQFDLHAGIAGVAFSE